MNQKNIAATSAIRFILSMVRHSSSQSVGDGRFVPVETSALLADQHRLDQEQGEECVERLDESRYGDIQKAVLPVAFLAALAMSATAASSIFAYANLLCKIPTDCHESERNLYAGAVAVASCIANICGLVILGFLEKLSQNNNKVVLALWLWCRSMSVVMLALGGENLLV